MKIRRLRFAVALVGLALWGCAPASPAPDASAGQSSRPLAASALAPPRTPLTVDWQAARAATVTIPESLSPKIAAQLDGIGMPVLVPDDATLHEGAILTHGPTWYALSMHAEGLNVLVQGQNAALERPALAAELAKDPVVADGRIVSVSDAITTVSFRRYGVHYTLDVECARAGADPRCASPDHALELVDRLIVVGGAP